MKLDERYYLGKDSKGYFKWNEKEVIRIEETEFKNKKTNANNRQNNNNQRR